MCLAPISHAGVFKCFDNFGNTIYKDTECESNERLDKIIEIEATIYPEIDSGPLGKNLLLNNLFENKLSDWRVPLGALWSVNGGVNNSGALVIHASKPPDDKFIYETVVEQCVILNAGEKFGVSADVKLVKTPLRASANRVNVIWYESTDCTTGGQWGAYIEPKAENFAWQKLSNTNLTPALGAKAAKITIVQNGRFSNDADVFWDNVVFSATEMFSQSVQPTVAASQDQFNLAIGENYILNGTFNENVESWRHGWKTEWTSLHGDVSAGAAMVKANSDSGSIGRSAFSQCVNFGNHSNFDLGASFKRDESSSQPGGGRLRLSWYQNNNCDGRSKTDIKWIDPQDVAGWQRLKVTGLRPAENSRSASIQIIQTVSGKGDFTAYWDDIYFKAVE